MDAKDLALSIARTANKISKQTSHSIPVKVVHNKIKDEYRVDFVPRDMPDEITKVSILIGKTKLTVERFNRSEAQLNAKAKFTFDQVYKAVQHARRWTKIALDNSDARDTPVWEDIRAFAQGISRLAKGYTVEVKSITSGYGKTIDVIVCTGHKHRIMFNPAMILDDGDVLDGSPVPPLAFPRVSAIYDEVEPNLKADVEQVLGKLNPKLLVEGAKLPSQMAELLNRAFKLISNVA